MSRRRVSALLALGLMAGCAREGPRQFDVSGMVTFRGQPIPAGVIQFDPDIANGYDGPQGFAQIKNGVFDTRLGGRGVRAGPHVVRVQGFDGVPANELPLGNRLFADYEIRADVQPGVDITIDVPALKK